MGTKNPNPAWIKCDCCDDYICTIHVGQHAYDCTCPHIEVWAENNLCPYDDPATDKVITFVNENPLSDDELD